MKQHLLLLGSALALSTACLTPVSEVQCGSDADCRAGARCIDSRCLLPDGGPATGGGSAGGGSTGGGSAGGGSAGGGSAGGGTAGGGTAGGGTTGGGPTGGGSAGGGSADAGCGCQTAAGRCVPGDSPLACGANGSKCVRCNLSDQCVAGACITAPCGPGTCTGCCLQGFCLAPSTQGNATCGAGGGMCTRCASGQRCQNGACVTATCDVMSCPTGCCENGQCLSGTSSRACGVGGATCRSCAGPCNQGQCVGLGGDGGTPPPRPDAGIAAPIGSECGQPGASCASGFCLPEDSLAGPTGFPGGYCSANCANATCPANSSCFSTSQFGVTLNACLATCAAIGTQSTCRTGYVCAPNSSATQGFCRPLCTNGGLADCDQTQTCDPMTGLCR